MVRSKSDWTNNEFLQPASININKTTDQHLKGSIGEMVAFKYLNCYCHVWSVGATGWPPNSIFRDRFALRFRYIKARQLRYLNHVFDRGKFVWDMLAIRSQEIDLKNVQTRYLVEVKTSFLPKGQIDFRARLPPRSEYMKMITEAKSFGFTPILVKVGMGEDWTFHVSCSELG